MLAPCPVLGLAGIENLPYGVGLIHQSLRCIGWYYSAYTLLYSALQAVQCTSPDVTALLTEQCQTSLKCYKKAKAGASMQNMASNAQRFRNQIVLFHRIVQCLTGRMCDVKYRLLHTEGWILHKSDMMC